MSQEFSITHNMKVGTISKNFKEIYGGTLRIYDASNHIADENEAISKFASKGIPGAEKFQAGPHLKISSFIKRLLDEYGLKVKVADSDDKKLMDEDLTLFQLREKLKK